MRSVRYSQRDIRFGLYRAFTQGRQKGTFLNRGRGGQGLGRGRLRFDSNAYSDMVPAPSTLHHYRQETDFSFGIKENIVQVQKIYVET